MYQFPDELRSAYESSPLAFVYYEVVDGHVIPVLVSDGFCRNAGKSREDAINWLSAGLFERIHPDDVGLVSRVSDEFMHHRGPYNIIFRRRIDPDHSALNREEVRPRYVKIHGIGKWQTMPDGTKLCVIAYDNLSRAREIVREKRESYQMFQKDRFYTDPLTGLPNLNYLHEFGQEKVNTVRTEGHMPCLIYTDICAMQSYNNQYGFEEGNRLLQMTAETMKNHFPGGLVTRGSDDHFILICALEDQKELERRLYEVNALIRRSAQGNTLGIRSGVCPVEENAGLSEALDHAKLALRQIENDLNREVAFFSQEADNIYWRNRYIVENFGQALEKGWFRVFYHALYRVESRKIAAFEGLARWIDPTRGVISPGEFVPVLIKYHLLYRLDLYMFEQVCREVKIRNDNDLPLLPVSVNFSRQDFDHADIAQEMDRLYEKYDLDRYVDKSYFIVEITEQDLATGSERLQEQLKQIREKGYQLWLDDFGSGYSAINLFSRFEFDLIKYDMDLLHHLDDHNGENRIILKELVKMARKLHIHTLVEGVETEEHVAFTKEIGCELAQGFYYHRPESLEEILYRVRGGEAVKPCESPEERESFRQRCWEEDSQ